MSGIYENVLLPLLDALYFFCDLLLGWSAALGPFWAITIVGLVSGLAVILFQKYATPQELLGRCKADIKLLKSKVREAKKAGDAEGARRLQSLSGRVGGKYMGLSLKPALWTVPLIGVIGLWTGARFSYAPVRPGEAVTVVAHFEDAATGFAHVIARGTLAPEGGVVASIGRPEGEEPAGLQARWTIRTKEAGASSFVVRHAGRSYDVALPVGRRTPEVVTVYNASTPGQDQLQAIELKLADSLPAAWWNLKLQWGGWYLVVALVVALALRRVMKIQ